VKPALSSAREGRSVLLAILALIAGFGWGYISGNRVLATQLSVWRGNGELSPAKTPAPDAAGVDRSAAPPGSPGQVDDMTAAELAAMGYLSGYEAAPHRAGVTTYLPDLAAGGLNLSVPGHEPEALLLDMRGRVLHRWHRTFPEVFPERADLDIKGVHKWRRAELFENGDLIAIFDSAGMVKLDKDSRVIWANPLAFHHDLFIDGEGRIYTLTKRIHLAPRIHPEEKIIEDFITVLDANGKVLRHVSVLEAFENSSYASVLDDMKEAGDIFHSNTIEVLDGSLGERSDRFAAGRVMVSVRELNAIALVDLDQTAVVWALSGQWTAQHQPTFLENGNLLLFDNKGHGGLSKVIEVDPFTQEIVWSYEGTPENGFYSECCGSNQRLENGNTLITETGSGRAFEVTPDRRIVWEYVNPARTGNDGELIAALYEVVRLPATFPIDWLPAPSDAMAGAIASRAEPADSRRER
jgi:hypothetical protein